MDFGNIFKKALKYPMNSNVYFFLLLINLIIFLTGIPVSSYEQQVLLGAQPPTLIFYAVSLAFFIASTIVGIFLLGIYLHNAYEYYAKKKYENLADSVSPSKKGFFHLLAGLVIILALALMAFFIFGGFSVFLTLSDLLTDILVATGVIAAFVIIYFFSLAPDYVIVDKHNAASALMHSYQTVKKNKIGTLVFLVLAVIFAVAINFVGAVPIISYSLVAGRYAISNLGQEVLMLFSLFQLLFTTYATLFLYSSLSNFYSEVRGKSKEVKKIVRAPKRKAPVRKGKKK